LKEQYIDQGKYVGHFFRDIFNDNLPKKYTYFHVGKDVYLFINDPEALEEISELHPSKTDWVALDKNSFGRLTGSEDRRMVETTEYKAR